jgi:DNA-binding SARP family transcriptional activator
MSEYPMVRVLVCRETGLRAGRCDVTQHDPGSFPDDGSDPALQRFLPHKAPSLVLQMLGGFRLLVDGQSVFLTPTAQRLVALVVLSGRISRSRAAGTLWPDLTEDRAAACLRTGIWRVNHVAEGLLEATRWTVDVTSRTDVDVRSYVRVAASSMRSGTRTPAADVRAATGYEGDLLPDWDEDWVLPDRERLRQLRLHLLEEEAERLAQSGRFGSALEAAFAALSADPRRESVHRRIIGIHLAEGNVSEARRAYAACRRVLRKDLGVEPAEATKRMLRTGARPDRRGTAAGWTGHRRIATG